MTKLEHDLINEKFKGVYARLDANNELIHATLARIEEQTKKTNGRVTALEFHKWKIIGASIAVSAIFATIISIAGLLKISTSEEDNKQKIEITTRGDTVNSFENK